jgi:PilZ domain-containing protein
MASDDTHQTETAAEIRPAVTDDKRQVERIQILGGLNGEVTMFQPMVIKQISRKGVQVETGFRLQIQSLHDLRLMLGDKSIIVKGRVVHCSISDVDQDVVLYRSGLEFVEPTERVISVINEFVASVKSGRQG